MGLGERICKLRTEKNMSQGDLADALEVSRQSISKWETNGSVPELDKLVKLSEIFGVSLDELVLGRQQAEPLSASEPKVIYLKEEERSTPKKTAGIALLCIAAVFWLMIALFGDVIGGLVLAAPFALCGVVCLLVKRYAGLWCAWIVYWFIELYLHFATGINWSYVLYPQIYTGGMIVQLIVAWTMLAAFMSLTLVTANCSEKLLPGSLRGNVIGVGAALGVYILSWFVFAVPVYGGETSYIHSQAYRYVMAVSGWLRNIVLAVAVIFTIRTIVSLYRKRKNT